MMTNAEKVRRYCSYQDRSKVEVRRKMAQLLIPAKEAETLMRELEEEKFVDDERFTESFIRGKMGLKRWGKVKLRAELAMRGIPSELISSQLAQIDQERYAENLQCLIQKWRHENPDGEREKLFRFLLSKGYETAEIIAKLREEGDN